MISARRNGEDLKIYYYWPLAEIFFLLCYALLRAHIMKKVIHAVLLTH